MEEYKEKLKISLRVTAVCAVILGIFSVTALCAEGGLLNITPVTGDSHWQSMWRGIVSGASCGVALMMLFGIIRISRALTNEAELKKLYIRDHDERQVQIWTSARALSMQIFLILGVVVGIIAGYFNMTVSITILACVVIHSLIGMACKLYYGRKF